MKQALSKAELKREVRKLMKRIEEAIDLGLWGTVETHISEIQALIDIRREAELNERIEETKQFKLVAQEGVVKVFKKTSNGEVETPYKAFITMSGKVGWRPNYIEAENNLPKAVMKKAEKLLKW